MFQKILVVLVLFFGCVAPQENSNTSIIKGKIFENNTNPNLGTEIAPSIPSENLRTKRQYILVPNQYLNSYPAQPNPYSVQPTQNMNQYPPQEVQPVPLDSRILQEVAIELLRVVEPLLETAAALNQSVNNVSSGNTNTS